MAAAAALRDATFSTTLFCLTGTLLLSLRDRSVCLYLVALRYGVFVGRISTKLVDNNKQVRTAGNSYSRFCIATFMQT